MLQQSSSASSCMQTLIVMKNHCTKCQHSTPFFLNGTTKVLTVSLYTSDITVVPHCINSTISTPFLSQKTAASSFLDNDVYLIFFGLFGDCVYINCFAWFQHSRMKPRFHHLLLVRSDWEIRRHVCGIALKSQSRSHSVHFVCTNEHF